LDIVERRVADDVRPLLGLSADAARTDDSSRLIFALSLSLGVIRSCPRLSITSKHRGWPKTNVFRDGSLLFKLQSGNTDCKVDPRLTLNAQRLKDDRLFVAPNKNLGAHTKPK
jgi:hypothetical protein